jgi:hypothetical protein
MVSTEDFCGVRSFFSETSSEQDMNSRLITTAKRIEVKNLIIVVFFKMKAFIPCGSITMLNYRWEASATAKNKLNL